MPHNDVRRTSDPAADIIQEILATLEDFKRTTEDRLTRIEHGVSQGAATQQFVEQVTNLAVQVGGNQTAPLPDPPPELIDACGQRGRQEVTVPIDGKHVTRIFTAPCDPTAKWRDMVTSVRASAPASL